MRRPAGAAAPPPTFTTVLRRITFLPGSRTSSIAEALSRAQLPDTPVTGTVADLLLSRLVILSRVPTGNWLLLTPGAPPLASNVRAAPWHTAPPLDPPPSIAKPVPVPAATKTSMPPAKAKTVFLRMRCSSRSLTSRTEGPGGGSTGLDQ